MILAATGGALYAAARACTTRGIPASTWPVEPQHQWFNRDDVISAACRPGAYFGPVPGFNAQLPDNVSQSAVFFPDVFVFDKKFQNPRTLSASLDMSGKSRRPRRLDQLHAFPVDHLTRFINRNDGHFGSHGAAGFPAETGIFTLTTVESSAKSATTA